MFQVIPLMVINFFTEVREIVIDQRMVPMFMIDYVTYDAMSVSS